MVDKSRRESAFRRALGQEIRSGRQLRGMSRERLAELAAISETTLGRIEREGPVDVSDTWRLAEVLGIPLPLLVRRAEEAALAGSGELTAEQKDQRVQGIERDLKELDELAQRRRAVEAAAYASDLDQLPHDDEDPAPMPGRAVKKSARREDEKRQD